MAPRSSCGRGMTCTPTTSPMRPAAAAPASTAAFTAATSPTTSAVTSPLPIFCQPSICTFAAFSMASLASIRATRPLVSIIPSASIFTAIEVSQEKKNQAASGSLEQLNFRGVRQVHRVSFIRVDVDFELIALIHATQQSFHDGRATALDPQIHVIAMLDAVILGVLRPHVHVTFRPDD